MHSLPTVVFYILETANRQQALRFACQLLETAYNQQQKVFVHTESQVEAERFDILLWVYRDESFIPHAIYNKHQQPNLQDSLPTWVQIGYGENPLDQQDILVNLSNQIPSYYQQADQTIEIVYADSATQQLARERFCHYREQGCTLRTTFLKTTPV